MTDQGSRLRRNGAYVPYFTTMPQVDEPINGAYNFRKSKFCRRRETMCHYLDIESRNKAVDLSKYDMIEFEAGTGTIVWPYKKDNYMEQPI